jgi:hypothetical protein
VPSPGRFPVGTTELDFELETRTHPARVKMTDEKKKKAYTLGGIIAFISIIMFASSFDVIEPTEYGLLKNEFTQAVDLTRVYSNGRYFVWLRHAFIKFPAYTPTLSYGLPFSPRKEIPARTGPEEGQDSGGGQPITLALAFQYRIAEQDVPSVYQTFGTLYEASYLRFVQQAITIVTQQYPPRKFFQMRRQIEAAMLVKANESLVAKGFAQVTGLQLAAVGFQANYEETITNIQLQEQLRVTKLYQLEVAAVLKGVDVLESKANATIRRINAEAAKEAAILINEANAVALGMEQETKAAMYSQLRQHLSWTTQQFLEYVKMKALNSQSSDNVVVGVSSVGSVANA